MTRRIITRTSTGDRGPPGSADIQILEAEQLGPNMSKLPNGNLLCKAVPIARVGWMVYGPGETPIKVDPGAGLAYVHRDAEALFNAACIGSFMGAAVVDEHPDEDVTPENWKELGQGFVTTNVYRGKGDDADVLLADIIITDAELIATVMAGKREVSCGYDADYEQTGIGQGKQTNIIGNHIALVEKGRCGPRCAIGDHEHKLKENEMTTRKLVLAVPAKRRAVLDARRKVLDAEEALAEVEAGSKGMSEDDEGPAEGMAGATHIHIHNGAKEETLDDGDEEDPTEARFKKMETGLAAVTDAVAAMTAAMRENAKSSSADDEESEEDENKKKKVKAEDDESDGDEEDDKKKKEAKDGEKEDKDGKTKDSAALQTGYAKVTSQAELLVPGFRMPTFDAKALRKTTVDAMCGARRRALDLACSTKDGMTLISSINGGKEPTLDTMTCVDVATLFNAAAGAKGLLNNRANTGDSKTMASAATSQTTNPKTLSIADVNKANAEFWAKMDKKQSA